MKLKRQLERVKVQILTQCPVGQQWMYHVSEQVTVLCLQLIKANR